MKKTLVFLAALLIFLLFNVQEGMTMPMVEGNKMKKAAKKIEEEKEKEEKEKEDDAEDE